MAGGKSAAAAKYYASNYRSASSAGGSSAAAAAVNLANPSNNAASAGGTQQGAQQLTGSGAQFVYAAATVANILTDNLTEAQINLLANFLSVVTSCIYAVLAVENPSDVNQG